MPAKQPSESRDTLLKNGLIVDGTGAKPYTAHMLIRDGRIYKISTRSPRTTGLVIDCAGHVVAPGFIDSHSRLDCQIARKGHDELKQPFIAQGITSVITGVEGASAAGFREDTHFSAQTADALEAHGPLDPEWHSVGDYLGQIASSGASHNIAILAGHGSARASLRGNDASPLHPYELQELLRILEVAMAEGARGVSIGLHRQPGGFARPEELRDIAQLVKRKAGVLAVRPRASSAFAPGYPVRLMGEAHNLIALREVLDLARTTGVRLQVSPLTFIGSRTWRTVEESLRLIDKAIADGVDVRFDTHPSSTGAGTVSSFLPSWFLARTPDAYEDTAMLHKLRRELFSLEMHLGLGASDILIVTTLDPDTADYDGVALSEMARMRRMSSVDALIDLSRHSGGKARILCRKHTAEAMVEVLMRHTASLFGTSARVETKSKLQNPAAYGAFPRFLQLARERNALSIEEAVRKMSGAVAERFAIGDRGILKEGLAADITVFDWETISGMASAEQPDASPVGIEYVFVNGQKIIGAGKREQPLTAGKPLA